MEANIFMRIREAPAVEDTESREGILTILKELQGRKISIGAVGLPSAGGACAGGGFFDHVERHVESHVRGPVQSVSECITQPDIDRVNAIVMLANVADETQLDLYAKILHDINQAIRKKEEDIIKELGSRDFKDATIQEIERWKNEAIDVLQDSYNAGGHDTDASLARLRAMYVFYCLNRFCRIINGGIASLVENASLGMSKFTQLLQTAVQFMITGTGTGLANAENVATNVSFVCLFLLNVLAVGGEITIIGVGVSASPIVVTLTAIYSVYNFRQLCTFIFYTGFTIARVGGGVLIGIALTPYYVYCAYISCTAFLNAYRWLTIEAGCEGSTVSSGSVVLVENTLTLDQIIFNNYSVAREKGEIFDMTSSVVPGGDLSRQHSNVSILTEMDDTRLIDTTTPVTIDSHPIISSFSGEVANNILSKASAGGGFRQLNPKEIMDCAREAVRESKNVKTNGIPPLKVLLKQRSFELGSDCEKTVMLRRSQSLPANFFSVSNDSQRGRERGRERGRDRSDEKERERGGGKRTKKRFKKLHKKATKKIKYSRTKKRNLYKKRKSSKK